VYIVEGQPVVKDLASLNGTFVNGERVGKAGLRGGDTIRVGNITIRIVEKTESRKQPDSAATQELEKRTWLPRQGARSPPAAAGPRGPTGHSAPEVVGNFALPRGASRHY